MEAVRNERWHLIHGFELTKTTTYNILNIGQLKFADRYNTAIDLRSQHLLFFILLFFDYIKCIANYIWL